MFDKWCSNVPHSAYCSCTNQEGCVLKCAWTKKIQSACNDTCFTSFLIVIYLIYMHCKKMLPIFPSPGETLPDREYFNYSRPVRVWSVTFRLWTGKSVTFFYSVTRWFWPRFASVRCAHPSFTAHLQAKRVLSILPATTRKIPVWEKNPRKS